MAGCKIVISGYYGFRNAGDEAMLYAILRSLRSIFPEPEITVISGSPEETAASFGVKAIPRFGGWAIARSLIRSDILISGGGSLLQDVTSSRSLLYYLSIIGMGVLLRKHVFLYGQGIGPLHRRWVCSLLSFVLSKVDAITVRDEKSHAFLQRLGVTAPLYTTADSVLSLPQVPLDTGRRILQKAGVREGKKVVGVSVRDWIGAERWASQCRTYLEKLSEKDVDIVLIPMQDPYDQRMAAVVDPKNGRVHCIEGSFTAPEWMSIIGNLDLLVGMRLHALIFAALMHVPVLGISYDPKIDNFLQSIGEKAVFPISAFDAETLYNKTEEVLQEKAPRQQWDGVERLRQKAMDTALILKKLVKA